MRISCGFFRGSCADRFQDLAQKNKVVFLVTLHYYNCVMVLTAAQKKANDKYKKANTKTIGFSVSLKYDKDIISQLEKQENKSDYIKSLIRKDIASEQ